MARRSRTTKALAQRIERYYFKRAFAMPRWRTRLTIIASLAGLGWMAWRAIVHDQTAFSSGPVNPRHASFEQQCATCHVLHTSMRSSVTNQACLTCHDGPIHNDEQTSTPDCVDCHVEHTGAPQLLGAGDKACNVCHADLKTRSGRHTVISQIESLSDHPEFRPFRTIHADPGTVKFNHKIHLRKDLKGPTGVTQLECSDCHRPTGILQPWPYGRSDTPDVIAAAIMPTPRARISTRAYMQPLNYYKQCSACHPLLADALSSEPLPHKKPETVVAFLEEKFRTYIGQHPEELRLATPALRIPRTKYEPPPRSSAEWILRRMEESERLLWSKTCAECHSLTRVGGLPTPKIQDVNLNARWLRHGSFDHAAHKMLDCTGCHTRTRNSERTSDVLIPSIQVCRTCHNPATSNPQASGRCFECHQYHDWSRERPLHGNFKPPSS